MKKNKDFKSFLLSPFFVIFSCISLCLFSFYLWFPSESEIKGCLKTRMYSVDLCPSSKQYVPLNQISKHLQNALLLTEDSAFYQHNGFDQEGIELCLQKMRTQKRIVCGGSTITQQLAKNMFLTKEKSFIRKGLEALITIKIEKTLSKKEILERYLNVVQFGKNIFGVKQAAQFYFKKSPAHLSVLESAFLAMVLPNPEKYSQSYYRNDLTKFARRRLNKIVNDMHKYNRIGDGDYLAAQDGLDFFFKSAQISEEAKQQDEVLTEEDLQEMFDQENE
jgi:monofunctional glycosyltransferase